MNLKSIHFLIYFLIAVFFGCNKVEKMDNESFVFKDRNYDHLIDRNNMRIAFGSCFDQSKSFSIFDAIKNTEPDMLIMLGDNVYGDDDTGELKKLKLAYEKQKSNFSLINLDFPVEAIWDDHDYGVNDGGKDFINKLKSKKLFLDFWDIPDSDIRNKRDGIYYDQIIELNDFNIHIIYLDTRYFRGPLLKTDSFGSKGKERYLPSFDESSSMLGEAQWSWLDKKLSLKSDIKIVVSAIQFLAVGHGWESWAMLPLEREKLINIIDKYNLNNIIFITGDRHRGGIYKMKTQNENIVFDITSSPINSSTYPGEEEGVYRLGNTYTETNFGLMTIDLLSKSTIFELKDKYGNSVISEKLLY